MPGDMADSIDWFVADEGMLATPEPLPTVWVDAQRRATPIVLLSNTHLVNAHRFAQRKGLRAPLVEALAQEIATRGIVLDADHLPVLSFDNDVPVWVDAVGGRHPVRQMDTPHLLNAHRFARRQGIEGEVVACMESEIARRGLAPHPLDTPSAGGPSA